MEWGAKSTYTNARIGEESLGEGDVMAPTDKTRLINYCGLCVRSQWKGQGGVEWLPARSGSIAELIYIITKKITRKGELKSGITGIILACNFPSNCRIVLQLIFFPLH